MQQAQARYGQRQPSRAAFLRKYLKAGMPDACIQQLGLKRMGLSANISGYSGIALMYDNSNENALDLPRANIDLIESSLGCIVDSACTSLWNTNIKGILYDCVTFGSDDVLTSARLHEHQMQEPGYTAELSEQLNKDHSTIYTVIIKGLRGREWIRFSSKMALLSGQIDGDLGPYSL